MLQANLNPPRQARAPPQAPAAAVPRAARPRRVALRAAASLAAAPDPLAAALPLRGKRVMFTGARPCPAASDGGCKAPRWAAPPYAAHRNAKPLRRAAVAGQYLSKTCFRLATTLITQHRGSTRGGSHPCS